MTLDAAKKALDRGDDAAALVALLGVWRTKKHPRIADAIDRVSARLLAATGAVEAKSVKARTEAWTALAKKKRSEDLGRLLATPWPGTWQNALPAVKLVKAFPEDPRIAVALVALVTDERYDTYRAMNFHHEILSAVVKVGDVRAIALLEAALQKPMSRYWREVTQRDVKNALANLVEQGEPPALTKAEAKTLDATCATFAGAIAAETTRARGRAELLAAIYADPGDDAARSVFADWLTERGDPHGEFIAIQLAHHEGRITAESIKREAALLKKHGRKFAGALDPVIGKELRVFERGFLASVVVDLSEDDPLGPALDDAAWATVHTLHVGWRLRSDKLYHSLLARPAFAGIRRVHGLEPRDVTALASDDTHTRIEELGLAYVTELEQPILDGKTYPNLRRLAVPGVEMVERLVASKVGRRLEQILTNRMEELAKLRDAVVALGFAPREIVAVGDWRLTLRADDHGRYTRLHAAPRHGRELPSPYDLGKVLATLEPDALTEIVVPLGVFDYVESTLAFIEGHLARFTGATIDVPWPRVSYAGVEPIVIDLYYDDQLDEARFRKVIERAQAAPLSLAFDTMTVGYTKEKPFVDVDTAAAWFVKPRTLNLELSRRGAREHASVEVNGSSAKIRAALRDTPAFVDELLAWVADLGTLCERHVGVRFVPNRDDYGWLMVCEGSRQLSLPTLERELAKLAWVRMKRVGKRLALVLSGRPSELPSKANLAALDRAFAKAKR